MTAELVHIYDWLDDPETGPPEVKDFFESMVAPAYKKDYSKIHNTLLSCTYKGKRYRCIGTSRMGDIWLTSDFTKAYGYELRIYINEVSNFKIEEIVNDTQSNH